MHEGEKSDLAVVAEKLPNKAGGPDAEAAEPRAGAKENAEQRNTGRTQSRESVLQSLGRIRQAAMRDKGAVFTALLHHVTPGLLDWAFFQWISAPVRPCRNRRLADRCTARAIGRRAPPWGR